MSDIKDVLLAMLDGNDAQSAALDAVSTTLTISTWTLTVIALGVGLVALFGYNAIKDGAHAIAKKTIDDYIRSDEFAALVNKRIDTLEAERRASQGLMEGNDDDADPFARETE